MSSNNLPNPPAITLDQLIALNDEIAALVHSGVPLEANLAEIGKDLPGTLGHITTLLANRAGQGESLPQLISQCSAQFPPVYRAVIEAGLRAGRLSAALECLSSNVRRLAESRRNVLSAALYPFLVIIVGWSCFAFFSGNTCTWIGCGFCGIRHAWKQSVGASCMARSMGLDLGTGLADFIDHFRHFGLAWIAPMHRGSVQPDWVESWHGCPGSVRCLLGRAMPLLPTCWRF